MGFESGDTSGWVRGPNTGVMIDPINEDGTGVTVTNATLNWDHPSRGAVGTPGSPYYQPPTDPASWTFSPHSNYMMALQPDNTVLFNSAANTLGLTPGQSSSISSLLSSQADAAGYGNGSITDAAYVYRDVSLTAGTTYQMAWNYIATDYVPFNDGSIATLVPLSVGGVTINNNIENYTLLGFTAPGTGDYSVGSFGSSGWQLVTYRVDTTGVYRLGFVVFNLDDTSLSPVLLIDDQRGLTTRNGLTFNPIDPNPGTNVYLLLNTPSGPSTEDTLASMRPNAYALRGAYSIQSAIINTGLNYDCTTFDAKGICVSAGGRVTDTNNPSTNSQGALLIASYRANDQWRVGAYLDQNLSSNDARGVNLDNNNPMGGVFAVWNQNTDGTGYQVRLASGYSDKDVTISRSAFGATGEAGKGDSSLQSQAYSATISRGFQLNNTRWIASPYLGLRYTKIKRAGYTEDSSADVTAPLTYSALSQETTTALVGVRFNGQLGDKINLMASAGIENDIAHNTGDYAATGVDGLTPIAFNQNIRHIRPVASAGASYAIDKRQTVGANLNFRQEAFNSTNSVSGMVTYQVGF